MNNKKRTTNNEQRTTILYFLASLLLLKLLFTPTLTTGEEVKKNYNRASKQNHKLSAQSFRLGNEVLLTEKFDLISDKPLAIITNTSGVLKDGTSFVDALNSKQGANIKKIFSPEHGFRGDDNDNNHPDEITGIPVISLYGKKKSPSAEDLTDTDILIYDIQDVGARFYTYTSTLYYCIKSAYENGKKIIICDRPVIGNPDYVDGFMMDENVKSFVGLFDIPISYGMTCGELANYINSEYFNSQTDLIVVRMSGYNRNSDYESLGLSWVKPSPSIYFPSSAVVYAGTCLLEGTNFSEGRGTDKPFEYVGAPYCDSELLKNEIDKFGLKGVEFEIISFTPTEISSPSNPPKFTGKKCNGLYIKVLDKNSFEPVKTGIALLLSLRKLFPEFKWRNDNYIDKLSGTKDFRKYINENLRLDEITSKYSQKLQNFVKLREKYVIY